MSREYTLRRAPVSAAKIDYAAELNAQQHEAVTAPPGPALVIAGAGSGKTRTLTYRVAYLLENGVQPFNILLLTFTNKAAREMLERVTSLLPNDTSGLWGGTFHSIGNRILRRHAEAAGFAEGFSIMDREDQQDMLDSVIVSCGIDLKEKRFPKGEVVADISSFAVNTGQSIEQVLLAKYPYFLDLQEQIEAVQKKYEARKKSANSVDFDDLLEKPLRLLQRDPAVAEHYQRQFQFILVDEYQDTNKIQADFIDMLAAQNKNVMVVGDDAQSIYSWRGANFQNILDFPKRYPGAKVYKIETNYRSVPEILQVANAAIAGNVRQFEKNLQAVRDDARVKPGLVPLADSNQQALFVTQRILDLREEGVELSEIAVLYRAHYHSMELQMELTRHGVPFAITSGLRFFEQAHVKDVAAFLKFAVNPRDEVAFKRIARLLPGIGARSAEQLWSETERAFANGGVDFKKLLPLKVPAKSRKPWEQLAHTLNEIAPDGKPLRPEAMLASVIEAIYDDYARNKFANYENRIEDLKTLRNYAAQYENPAEFLDQLALLSGVETETELGTREEDGEMVNLSSVHQAKGLEWKVVFVIWMADGMFPSSRSLESEDAVEEERRLFYVAVTRARDELYLTYPHMRLNAGYGEMYQRPSRFLGEVPKELLEEWQINGGF
jgi:DNA helicase-2/ATP-dependent DNA helicase PcrA